MSNVSQTDLSYRRHPLCCPDTRPGVRCRPTVEENRLECSLPQQPNFAIDHKEPIVVQWPPECGQGDCEPDTGMRPDLLAKIPDQFAEQVVSVEGVPSAGQTVSNWVSPVQHHKINHPLVPDAQLHVRIDPPQPIKTEIRIPDMGCAVRQPKRKWRQCIENTLINDRVRRPMARWCHKRPMPPLVLSTCEHERLLLKCTELERKAREKEARIKARECARLESRKRMGEWNYTVESLLEKKKAQEEAKEMAERESFDKLLKDIKNGRDKESEVQTQRANRQKMYRKGLIQDLHAAMAFSKMMQDIDRSRQIDPEDDEMEQTLPICERRCMKKMLGVTDRPDLADLADKPPKRVNERLLKTLQSIEARTKQQQREVNNAVSATKQLLKDNLPELPQAYLKHVKEPECDEETTPEELRDIKFFNRRNAFYEELDEKLAVDAFIDAHEKEVERQACEYRKYYYDQKYIRKSTEQRLIKEKVARNIAMSEKAAAALVAARAKEQKDKIKKKGGTYEELRDKWEDEWDDKKEEEKKRKEHIMEVIVKDFWCRKGVERCKNIMRGNTREWAKEVKAAAEIYDEECVRKNIRRQKAEEIQLYNKNLASERLCQANREVALAQAWSEKIKNQYFEEMQEMKNYGNDCIREWEGKGRNTLPLRYAMKKWEWDAGMDPRMFREWEKKKAALANYAQGGGGDADNRFAEVIITKSNIGAKNVCQNSTVQQCDQTTQSTSRRLGFC